MALSETARPKAYLKPLLLGVMALIAVLTIAFWVLIVNDRDFYRPAAPVICAVPPEGSKPFRFASYGDWGEGTFFQKALAAQLIKTYQKTPFPIVALLGDNIYEEGDINNLAHDYFEVPYAPLIAAHVRFWPAMGNHDIKENHIGDQIRYFHLPGPYYTVRKGPIEFFFINTNKYAIDVPQQVWLAQKLASSDAQWKIVLGHHPMYSSGGHGDTTWVREKLQPLMEKYSVDLYLSGHDHDYERFEPVRGVHYTVSGGGGAFLTDFKRIRAGSVTHLRVHHYLIVEILGRDIWIKAINRFGDIIDCEHWQQPLHNQKTLNPAT